MGPVRFAPRAAAMVVTVGGPASAEPPPLPPPVPPSVLPGAVYSSWLGQVFEALLPCTENGPPETTTRMPS